MRVCNAFIAFSGTACPARPGATPQTARVADSNRIPDRRPRRAIRRGDPTCRIEAAGYTRTAPYEEALVNGANTAHRAVCAGSLDDPSWYRASREIYVASAQPWSLVHPDIPHDEGMPGRA